MKGSSTGCSLVPARASSSLSPRSQHNPCNKLRETGHFSIEALLGHRVCHDQNSSRLRSRNHEWNPVFSGHTRAVQESDRLPSPCGFSVNRATLSGLVATYCTLCSNTARRWRGVSLTQRLSRQWLKKGLRKRGHGEAGSDTGCLFRRSR